MKFLKIAFIGMFFAAVIAAGVYILSPLLTTAETIHELLGENKKLTQSLAQLVHEDQIGYAKVLSQDVRDGRLYTRFRFVETARDDKLRTILDKEYEVEGDTVYFDALIVTFSEHGVMDGKERSLYLWRRVYGEKQAPSDGYPIEGEGAVPGRYSDLLNRLRIPEQNLFWTAVWDLANDPEALRQYGIKAVYGNAVYKKVRPGLIYVFKINSTGHVYPETIPEL